MEAPVDVVLRVSLDFDLVRVDELVPRANPACDVDGVLELEGSEARAHGRHADAPRAEDPVSDREHERAVDAAGIADEDRAHLLEDGGQAVEARVFWQAVGKGYCGRSVHVTYLVLERARVDLASSPCARVAGGPRSRFHAKGADFWGAPCAEGGC